MGAVDKSDNVKVRNKKKNGIVKHKFNKSARAWHGRQQPPSHQSFPPFSLNMRPRPPFPPGRMPPPGPGIRPPLPGMRMPPSTGGPPSLFRNRVPPPPRMGQRGNMPPLNMRPRVRPPLMGPPPLMRPPPPMMCPRRFPPPPPNMLPPNNKLRQLKNKINANKRNNRKRHNGQNQIDLSSPWVTPEIKAEFENKDKLYKTAKESNKSEDWDKFKEQRTTCDKMYKAAKLEYIGKHPEEIHEDDAENEYESGEENECEKEYENKFEGEYKNEYWEEYENDCWEEYENEDNTEAYEDSDNFCDACEKGFATAAQLQYHMKEHRVCGIDGCKFVAHAKIVEKHIDMQHVSGLYYRMNKSDSPEDIKKWIEERKKKYPTKENIEQRQKEQEELFNRGERLTESKDRFGRKLKRDTTRKRNHQNKKNRYKNKKNKLSHLRKMPPKVKKLTKKDFPVSLLDDKSNWNGKIQPFQGTSELYESEKEIEEQDDKFNDDEWLGEEQKYTPKIEINNALGALIGAYRSSDESDYEINVPESKEVTKPQMPEEKNETNNEEADDAPDEIKIKKDSNQYIENMNENNTKEEKNKRHRKRKRKHSCNENTFVKKKPESTLNNQKTFSRNITLLERLLAPEIKHERNLILQCVRYVIKNNFFDNPNLENTNKLENENLIVQNDESLNCENISLSKNELKVSEPKINVDLNNISSDFFNTVVENKQNICDLNISTSENEISNKTGEENENKDSLENKQSICDENINKLENENLIVENNELLNCENISQSNNEVEVSKINVDLDNTNSDSFDKVVEKEQSIFDLNTSANENEISNKTVKENINNDSLENKQSICEENISKLENENLILQNEESLNCENISQSKNELKVSEPKINVNLNNTSSDSFDKVVENKQNICENEISNKTGEENENIDSHAISSKNEIEVPIDTDLENTNNCKSSDINSENKNSSVKSIDTNLENKKMFVIMKIK